jgi:hypothetical protein
MVPYGAEMLNLGLRDIYIEIFYEEMPMKMLWMHQMCVQTGDSYGPVANCALGDDAWSW